MKLEEILVNNQTDIINEAFELLQRSHLKHYDSSRADENWQRLAKLLDLTVSGIQTRSLVEMISYSEKVAKERYESGFDLHEVHTAYNVIEEVMWKKVINEIESTKIAEALGLISTILGTGKESLALAYVALASKRKAKSLNLTQLFKGV
jgi:transcriptional regulator with GAF, ATPase, and Fis domain